MILLKEMNILKSQKKLQQKNIDLNFYKASKIYRIKEIQNFSIQQIENELKELVRILKMEKF